MDFQPYCMCMPSDTEEQSILPTPAEVARQAQEQERLYKEAKENPERVVPAMFIEDCARCEEVAIQRRNNGFYTHFYSTLPNSEGADIVKGDLPDALQSAGQVHQAIDSETLEADSTDTTTAPELWAEIGKDDYPGKVCQPPLLNYIDREDCYIHAEPTRVGFSYGLPVFIYKRRQSHNHFGTFCASETVYLWLCGWILHANKFFQPNDFVPSLFFLKVVDSSTVAPKLISKAEEIVFEFGFPGVDNPDISSLPDGLNFTPFHYEKDMFADKLKQWRRLYFGERVPQGCGNCEVCQNGRLEGTGPWRPI